VDPWQTAYFIIARIHSFTRKSPIEAALYNADDSIGKVIQLLKAA
jgi:hypothetical protein